MSSSLDPVLSSRVLLLLLAVLCAGALWSAPPKPSAKPLCYVAPNGNDRWSGNLTAPNKAGTDGPLATFAAAQRKVREARQADPSRPLTVLFRGGVYRLTEPIVFTPEDSGREGAPVTYAALPGEKPIFTGGDVIGGWQKGQGNLWIAQLPAVKAGQWYPKQLFVNGRRCQRARTPNDDFFHLADTVVPLSGDRSKLPPESRLGFRFKPGELQPYRELGDVNIIVYHAWTSSRHWIKDLDEATNTVHFTNPSGWPIGYWDRHARYYVENCLEALDSPGEWYLSRQTGTLYYWPRPNEDMRRAEAIMPRLQHLVEVKGEAALGLNVEYLALRGLSFQHAEWEHDPSKVCDGQANVHTTAAIVANGLRHSSFEGCEIAHVGEYAMILGDGCKDNKVQQCEIHDLGGGGVRIGETALPPEFERQADHNVVDNCFIHDGGHVFEAGIGVWIGRSSYNTVSHNEICDLYYSGCSVGWSWGYAESTANHNVFEYNHIHHIGQGLLSDMGGIYSLGISPGTVERFNRIHDVYSYSYGGWGLYTDEGSSDMVLENNVVYNTKTGGFHQHYGQRNTIRNNVFGRSLEADIISQRIDLPNDLTFERNVVSVDNGTPLGGNLTPDRFTLRNNVYWDTQGNELDFYGHTFAEWQALGKDAGSIVANPWKAPDELNFAPDGPLAKIGFQPFDMSPCGLYGDPAWVAKPKKLVHAEVKLPPPPQPKLVTDDFETTAVGMIPEAQAVNEEGEATIRVTDEVAATGKHSLKFVDAPGLKFNWQPHLVYRPALKQGTIRFSFQARLEEGAILWQEWRDSANPYRVGPSLRIKANGELSVGDKVLLTVPRSQWLGFTIVCPVGKQATGTWDLTVKLPGQEAKTFTGLDCGSKKSFRSLEWLGFISEATTRTVFYVDDLKMEVVKP